MKIGLRTFKTAISAVLAILLAESLGLTTPATAGIIAVLSVTNTKKSSFKIGIGRLVAFVIALLIATICYQIIGFNAFAFGFYLLLYIPIAVRLNFSEAIVVNSVLMTHFLAAKEVSEALIFNAFGLLVIGVGLALLANLYIPSQTKWLEENVKTVDETIQFLLKKMASSILNKSSRLDCELVLEGLAKSIAQGEEPARRQMENQLLTVDNYHFNYFQMRRMQWSILEDMLGRIKKLDIDKKHAHFLVEFMEHLAQEYGEENDGLRLKEEVVKLSNYYQKQALPQTRNEFENRAHLFQLLHDLEAFIDIKINFSLLLRD
ncbi:aromatic acid exporter family protein [Vagococcus sp.]|uniref:aromatic acid exporter family protein n=1 Tax=Vagococcus sp. TaxID=1933889 RepID=UPI003F98C04D